MVLPNTAKQTLASCFSRQTTLSPSSIDHNRSPSMQLAIDDPSPWITTLQGASPQRNAKEDRSGLAPSYNRNLEGRNLTIHLASGA
jgi:hypothetical protein